MHSFSSNMLFDSLSQIAFIPLFSIQSLKWYSATILITFTNIICTALFFVFLKVEVRLSSGIGKVQDWPQISHCNVLGADWFSLLVPREFFFFGHSFRFLPLWLCSSVCLTDTRPWWSLIWMECVRDREATGSNIMNVLSSRTLLVRKHWKACFCFTGAHPNLLQCVDGAQKTVAIKLQRTLWIHKM